MAGQGEVIIATILVLPVRCRTGVIGPYLGMQSTCSHLLQSVLMSNGHSGERTLGLGEVSTEPKLLYQRQIYSVCNLKGKGCTV